MPALTVSSVNVTTNELTITAHDLSTGDGPVATRNVGGTLPAPLAAVTDYWVIRVDDNTVKLADSSANALLGTAIDLTTIGTGTQILEIGIPYRRARTYVAAPAPGSQLKSADLNALMDTAKALHALVTGQAQSIWDGISAFVFKSAAGLLQPVAGFAKLHSQTIGGREMMACAPGHNVDSIASYVMQPSIARREVQWVGPDGAGGTGTTRLGGPGPLTGGTATGRAWASSNFYTQSQRLGYVSGAGAGSIAYFRQEGHTWRGNAARLGGFHAIFRFAISDPSLVGTARMFVGLGPNTSPTDVDPSTLTNLIGIGCNNGDTQLQLYAAGAVAQSRVALGANFPCNTVSTDVYELALFAAPNGSDIGYLVTRLNTGQTVSGTVGVSANLPVNTVVLSPQIWRTNGTTAAAAAFDLMGIYVEQGD